MALIKLDLFSKSLMRTVTVNAVIPTDKFYGSKAEADKAPRRPKFKTLYLLHGIFGNYTDWITGTRIQSLAEARNLAVIMPCGDNKFYLDNWKSGENYGTFVGEELVELTRKTFPLSEKREDTFIGGLSMGGYGAMRNGLKYTDTFGYIAALSSALILDGVYASQYKDEWSIGNRYYYESIFGNIDELKGSDKDYYALVENALKEGKTLPKIYMACGTEDGLFEPNERFHNFLTEKGVEHVFDKGPGIHNWAFWDEYIEKAMNYLPIGDFAAGISSGNVE